MLTVFCGCKNTKKINRFDKKFWFFCRVFRVLRVIRGVTIIILNENYWFWRRLFISSSVGIYNLYCDEKSCLLSESIEYSTTVLSFCEHKMIPIVGLSVSVRFCFSYSLTYISIWPTSWGVNVPVFKSIRTKHFKI